MVRAGDCASASLKMSSIESLPVKFASSRRLDLQSAKWGPARSLECTHLLGALLLDPAGIWDTRALANGGSCDADIVQEPYFWRGARTRVQHRGGCLRDGVSNPAPGTALLQRGKRVLGQRSALHSREKGLTRARGTHHQSGPRTRGRSHTAPASLHRKGVGGGAPRPPERFRGPEISKILKSQSQQFGNFEFVKFTFDIKVVMLTLGLNFLSFLFGIRSPSHHRRVNRRPAEERESKRGIGCVLGE